MGHRVTALVTPRRRSFAPPAEPPDIPTSAPYNVATFLNIPTYEGSGQAVHPDVIDFRNEASVVGDTWQGWRFWMAMTPYPNSQDEWEDPSILVSQDGIGWQIPSGLTNPVYRPTSGPYNNDPDLVYDPDTDELVLFYRDYFQWRAARSADGVTWPATSTLIQETIGVSPSVLLDGEGTWHRWSAQGSYQTAPAETGPWTTPAGSSSGSLGWHSNVVFAPGGGFHAIAHYNGTGEKYMRALSSPDGLNWTANVTPVLVSGTFDWSATNLYRAAMTLHEDGDRYRVWYSGQGLPGVGPASYPWHMAYTEIPLTEWPAIP